MRKQIRWSAGLFVLLCLTLGEVPMLGNVAAHSGTVLSKWPVTTPTINGRVDCYYVYGGGLFAQPQCKEWTDADSLDYSVDVGVMTVNGTVYVKNDYHNLYVMVTAETDMDLSDGVRIFFDNNHSGNAGFDNLDDALQLRGDKIFEDRYYSSGSNTFVNDLDAAGGSRDGFGMSGYDVFTDSWVFELVHPLNTTETRDFGLSVGDTVGFGMHYFENLGGPFFVFNNHDYVVAGPPSPPTANAWRDLTIDAIEVTQAVQKLDSLNGALPNYLPLVRNKPTVVRVYPDTNSGAPDTPSMVFLHGASLLSGHNSREAVSLGTLSATITANDDHARRDRITDSVNFVLPASWINVDILFLKVFVKASGTVAEQSYDNNWSPERRYEFTTTRTFNIYVVPINEADEVVFGVAPAQGATLKTDAKIRYVDFNNAQNSLSNLDVREPGEPIVYDINGDGEFGAGETTIVSGSTTLRIRDDAKIRFVDSNSNGVRNLGEAVIYSSDGDNVYDAGEPVIVGTAPAAGTVTVDDPKLKYADADNDATWDRLPTAGEWDEVVFYDQDADGAFDTGEPVLTLKTDGQLKYRDSNLGNTWNGGEPIIRESPMSNNAAFNGAAILPANSDIEDAQDFLAQIYPFPDVNFERGTWSQVGVWTYGFGRPLNEVLSRLWTDIVVGRVLACVFFGRCLPIPDVVFGALQSSGGSSYPVWSWSYGAPAAAGHVANTDVTYNWIMAHETGHDLELVPGDGEIVVYSANSFWDVTDTVIDGTVTPRYLNPLSDDPKLVYRDSNGSNSWDAGEAVVYSGDLVYDSGEIVLVGATPAAGAALKDDAGIKFVDTNANTPARWTPGSWGRHVSGPRITDPAGIAAYGCGAGGPDPNWPASNDNIGEYGFDTTAMAVVPVTNPDIMSYRSPTCPTGGPVGWISPYRWQKIVEAFDPVAVAGGAISPDNLSHYYSSNTETTTGDTLVVSGDIFGSGGGKIENIVQLPGQLQQQPSTAGSFSVVALDGQGQTVASEGFEPLFENDEAMLEDPAPFLVTLPYSPTIAAVQLRMGTVTVDQRTPSPGIPTVTVLSPNGGETWSGVHTIAWAATDPDGDQLIYTVQYNKDGGAVWTDISAPELKGQTQLEVDSSTIPGGNALVRVLASDGFHTSMDSSDSYFSVTPKPPSANIIRPVGGSTSMFDAEILFQGNAVDPEDGELPGSSLEWRSSIDGVLGNGNMLSVRLSPGTHSITLFATDSSQNQATVTVTLVVLVPNVIEMFELDWADYDNSASITIIDVAHIAFVFDGPDLYWDLYLDGKVEITEVALVAINFDRTFGQQFYPGQGFPPGSMDQAWTSLCGSLLQYQNYCQTRI